ncbi:MAG: NADH-quinone oxidoreductase subunit E, partial [Caldilinea sp.]
TKINGVGPVFDQRLKEAGILTFADLAVRTPAEIAEIIKWSQSRVERSEIIEQARRLAMGDI